jgi:hypothetical protein
MTTTDSVLRSPTTGLFERSAHLYGRETELEQITREFARLTDRSVAIVLAGEGGTGKTSLLLRVEAYLRQASPPFLPLYDFYHIDNFKASSIEAAIVEALETKSAGPSPFEPYARCRDALDHARQSGDAFREAQRRTRKAFIDCYNQFAAAERKRGRPVVLLFDSLEQAVDLSDQAEAYMRGISKEANKGGAFWLAAMLPRLRNTVAILAGRRETLFGQPVDLYGTLNEKMPGRTRTILLGGLPDDAERQFILDQRAKLIDSEQPDIRELAKSIDFDDQTFVVWRAVSGGLPFWDSMLLTSAMLGAIPPEIDQLREQVFAGRPISVSPDQRRAIRESLMRQILEQGVRANDQPLTLVLQWLAFIRKGATPAILSAVANDQRMSIDIAEVYAQLKQLDIVKIRRSPYARAADSQAEDMLFLHDEIYYWLDQDRSMQQQLRPVVSAAVMRF